MNEDNPSGKVPAQPGPMTHLDRIRLREATKFHQARIRGRLTAWGHLRYQAIERALAAARVVQRWGGAR